MYYLQAKQVQRIGSSSIMKPLFIASLHLDKNKLHHFFKKNKNNLFSILSLLRQGLAKRYDSKSLVWSQSMSTYKQILCVLHNFYMGDNTYREQFLLVVEELVFAFFTEEEQEFVLEFLLFGDQSLVTYVKDEHDLKRGDSSVYPHFRINYPQSRVLPKNISKILNYLQVYTKNLYLGKKIQEDLSEELFLFNKSIALKELDSELNFSQMIQTKLMKEEAKFFNKKALIYHGVKTFFHAPLFATRTVLSFKELKNDWHIEKKLKSVASGLTYKQAHKAAVIPCLEFVLQVGYTHSPKNSKLIYQIAALYPLTDDILDDSNIVLDEKIALCMTIQKFFKDFIKTGVNPIEKYNTRLPTSIIEVFKQLDTTDGALDYPRIWRCLLELNRWQRISALQNKNDIHGLSLNYSFYEIMAKKNAVTLELICLIAIPGISEVDLRICRRLGVVLQLFDDFEDLIEDSTNGTFTFAWQYITGGNQHDKSTRAIEAYHQTYKFAQLLYINLEEIINDLCKDKTPLSQYIFHVMYTNLLRVLTLTENIARKVESTIETETPTSSLR